MDLGLVWINNLFAAYSTMISTHV